MKRVIERGAYFSAGGFTGAAVLNASKELAAAAPAGELIHWAPTGVLLVAAGLCLLQALALSAPRHTV